MRNVEAKVVLLGPASVGKTCIVTRATTDLFDQDQVPTIGAAFSAKTFTGDNMRVTLRIWDTAGQERFRSLAPMYYQHSRAAVIVFSLDDRGTLEEAKNWFDELREQLDPLPMIYLVGNKSDLTNQRDIEPDEGPQIAEAMGDGIVYFETSAKTGQNVNELFEHIADRVQKGDVPPSPNALVATSESRSGCKC